MARVFLPSMRTVCHVCSPASPAVLQYMQHHGVDYQVLPLPTNEPNKSFDLVFQVAEELEKFKINRWATSAKSLQVLCLQYSCSCA